MFVRWQKHKQSHRFNEGFTHRCILVESRRVDGEPRLHHVAFLSTYRTSADGKISATRRADFLDEVAQRLDKLGNRVTREQRLQIEAEIANRVTRPTEAEIEADLQALARRMGKLKAAVAALR
jgi:hypothetical protein